MYNYFYNIKNVREKLNLKPVVCKSCSDDGLSHGTCKTCLENQAYNREVLETTPFVFDTDFANYHSSDHDFIKALPLRLPNEHPYLYYGIELEIEFDDCSVNCRDYGDDYDNEENNFGYEEVLERFSEICPLFIYEHDGSLDNGIEFISRPCSYAFWTSDKTVKMLKEGMEYLRGQGAFVDQPTGNGFHIHVSRKFFDNGDTKLTDRRNAYTKFDWLFQIFQPELEVLGRRNYTEYCEGKASKLRQELRPWNWSSRYNVELSAKCKLKEGGEMAREDHHSAVTVSGHTIEGRIFKSTTDYKEILATIEIMRNMSHAVRDNNIDTSFNEILHSTDNLYLDEYMTKIARYYKKAGKAFDFDKKNTGEIDIEINLQ